MTARRSATRIRRARGTITIRSSAAVAILALATGAGFWAGHQSASHERPGADTAALAVAPSNAMDGSMPVSTADAPAGDARALASAYDGLVVQEWDTIEAQLPGSAGRGSSVLDDPLATP